MSYNPPDHNIVDPIYHEQEPDWHYIEGTIEQFAVHVRGAMTQKDRHTALIHCQKLQELVDDLKFEVEEMK